MKRNSKDLAVFQSGFLIPHLNVHPKSLKFSTFDRSALEMKLNICYIYRGFPRNSMNNSR